MKKNNYYWMAPLAMALVACNDDVIDDVVDYGGNPTSAHGESHSELAEDVKVYPLLYKNFRNADDVEILAADTSSMTVNSALLDAMRVKLEPGNVISVWTAPEDIPFMRRVEDVTRDGSNYRLRTRSVGLDEVLKEAHLEFDSKVYVNSDEMPRNADGTINDRYYQSEGDGVYHPSALWYHTQQEDAQLRGKSLNRGAADDDVLKLGYDRERTFIVEDMAQTRASCDLGVKFNASVEDLTCPIVEDGDTIASIGLQKAEFAFDGGLHARLDCSFWNGVECFEVGPYYSLEGSLKAGVKVSSDLFELEKEYTLAECQGFTTCFWVGPVPVVVSFTPSVVFNTTLKGSAEGTVGAEVNFHGSHHTYACYEHEKWHLDEGGEPFTYDVTPYVGGSLGLEFQTGLYAKAAVSLYGVAGPTVAVGPYFKATAEASVDLIEPDIAAKVTATVGLGGKVGAELKIWRWNLAKWEMGLDLLSKEILNKSFSLNEWIDEMDKTQQVMPTGNNTDWKAKQAEVEKEQHYQEDIDDIIADDEKMLKRFIHFMDPAFNLQREDSWYRDHTRYTSEWQTIKDEHNTFYNWNLEYALWKSTFTENFELANQISAHIAKDIQTKVELLENTLPARIRAAFEHSVIGCDMSVVDALTQYHVQVEKALVEDMENIRAERQKRLEYGRMTGTYSEEVSRDYFTPWYHTFCNK